ncbi:MAG: hypothetical protein HYR55_04165 [Acidobacteria bacterium]|nr:hypothetical protein [Acidobacteriota bacterium]MBI3656425.1 hypothetical protein [Acidobacteriota bacterium]
MSKKKRKVSRRRLAPSARSLTQEVRYIIERAIAGEARIVAFGPLILFSTDTGDAWIMEPASALAVRLLRDGSRLPVEIVETESSFGVGWNSHYEIDGESFIVTEESGRSLVICGYPMREISRVIEQMRSRQ